MLVAAGTLLEGKYRVERLLGAGGMGSVWVAEHAMLGRPVAVKILDSTAKKDATAVQRFLREAQTAARLRSDHIVDVLDVGLFEDGTPYLVMELLEGETLAARIKGLGRLTQHEAASFVDQLLDGLGAAHAAGVIHRDIKPDNCFVLDKNERAHLKLLDFGISKVAGDPRELRMTKTGVVMGTPYYMAPEQARGSKDVDHRCDLYAAGAILYECVTGRVPFDAESVNELLFKIVLEPLTPASVHAPEVTPDFDALILRAMSREAGDRFQTAKAFREALTPWVGARSLGSGNVMPPTGLRTPASLPAAGAGSSSPSSPSAPSPSPSSPSTPGSGNAARVVVRSTPPGEGAPSRASDPIHAIAATAPIESNDAMLALRGSGAGNEPPTRVTPSGLLGMSATGPIHPSQSAPKKKGATAWLAIGALALALVGGATWVATRGGGTSGGGTSVGGPKAEADLGATPTTTATTAKHEPAVLVPSKAAESADSVGAAPLPSVGASGTAVGDPKKPAASPTSHPSSHAPSHAPSHKPLVAPPPDGLPTSQSPRPIDTTL